MADYTIINGTHGELTNVNAGGVDVPADSIRDSITLTTTELAAVCVTAGVAVMKDASTYQAKREIRRVLKYKQVSL